MSRTQGRSRQQLLLPLLAANEVKILDLGETRPFAFLHHAQDKLLRMTESVSQPAQAEQPPPVYRWDELAQQMRPDAEQYEIQARR